MKPIYTDIEVTTVTCLCGGTLGTNTDSPVGGVLTHTLPTCTRSYSWQTVAEAADFLQRVRKHHESVQ